MPDYMFTDPFRNRQYESHGRPGYRPELVAGVPEALLSLNAMMESYLAPERDLTPVVEALRAATPAQVEAVRHLMIHALERVGNATFDRAMTTSSALHLEYGKLSDRHDAASFVGEVADAVRADVADAMARLIDCPRDENLARRAAELVRVSCEGAIDCRRMAGVSGSGTLSAAGEALGAEAARAGARLQRIKEGLGGMGPEYASTVAAIPDASAIEGDAVTRSARIGTRLGFDRMGLKGLIDALGGGRDGSIARWGFNGRLPDRGHVPGYNDAEPAPLTETQAVTLRDRTADILAAYDDMCHRPGFGGCLTQVLCGLETWHGSDADSFGLKFGLRRLMDRADGVPEPDRTLTFHRFEQAAGDSGLHKPTRLLVGTAGDGDMPVMVVYPTDPTRAGTKGRGPFSYVAFVPADRVAEAAEGGFTLGTCGDGAPTVGGTEAFGTNFHGMQDVETWLRGTPMDHVCPGFGPVTVEYGAEPYEAPRAAPAPMA